MSYNMTTPIGDQRCDSCRFWRCPEHLPNSQGECHINPPLADPADAYGFWPATRDDDWCGKWEGKG